MFTFVDMEERDRINTKYSLEEIREKIEDDMFSKKMLETGARIFRSNIYDGIEDDDKANLIKKINTTNDIIRRFDEEIKNGLEIEQQILNNIHLKDDDL